MFVGSVQISSRLDSQSKFQMFTKSFANMAALYGALSKYAQDISTNI